MISSAPIFAQVYTHTRRTCLCVCVTDALRDALAQVKELNRQVPELHAIKLQLETERDGLKTEVSDLQDALKDALARLDAANNNLAQLRADLERRLHEKDEEIDGIRSVSHTESCLLKQYETRVHTFRDDHVLPPSYFLTTALILY